MIRVTCYQRSLPDQVCEVFVDRDDVSSCERAFQGGDLYAWLLTMKTGQQYAISQADFLLLKIIDHKSSDYSARHS
jgi:hypothetical protein